MNDILDNIIKCNNIINENFNDNIKQNIDHVINKLCKYCEELQMEIKNREESLAIINGTYNSQHIELIELRNEVKQLRENEYILSEENNNLKLEHEQYFNTIQEKNQLLENESNKYNELKDKFDELVEVNNKNIIVMNQLKENEKKLLEQNKQLNKNVVMKEAEGIRECRTLRAKLSMNESETNELRSEIENILNEHNRLKRSATSRNDQVLKLQERCVTLEKENQEITQNTSKLKRKVFLLNSKQQMNERVIKTLKRDKVQLETQMKLLLQYYAKHTQQLNQIQRQDNQLNHIQKQQQRRTHSAAFGDQLSPFIAKEKLRGMYNDQ